MGRLIVVGSLNIDTVLAVAHHPAPGETVLSHNSQTSWGGKGANQAVAAARASKSAGSLAQVLLIGRVGDDDEGRGYRAHLEALGVDVSGLRSTPGARTGSAVVVVSETGENTVIVSAGANAFLGVDDLPPVDGLYPDDVIVVTLEVPLPVVVRVSEQAAASGARFVLNLSPVVELPDVVVRRANPIVVNEGEAKQLAARYEALDSVLITRGAEGSEWQGRVVSARRDIEVIDTTGAGDAYCGTLALRLALGDEPGAAMAAATAAAASAVGRSGAQ